MHTILPNGGNTYLSKASITSNELLLKLSWYPDSNVQLKLIAFIVDEDMKVRHPSHFVSEHAPQSNDLTLQWLGKQGNMEVMRINIDTLLDDVNTEPAHKIIFATYLAPQENNKLTFRKIQKLTVSLHDASLTHDITFSLQEALNDPHYGFYDRNAMTVGELYLHQGEIKFKAIADAFKDGLYSIVKMTHALEIVL